MIAPVEPPSLPVEPPSLQASMQAMISKLTAKNFPVEALPVDVNDPLWKEMRTEYEFSLVEVALLKKRTRDQMSCASPGPSATGEKLARYVIVDLDEGSIFRE